MADFDWGSLASKLAGVAAPIYAANQNQNAAQDALNTQTQANTNATNTLNNQQQQAVQMFGPYTSLGIKGAGNLLSDNLMNDPGLEYARSEGEKAINRNAAATQGFNSGRRLKDLIRFNQGNATKFYDNAYNRNMQMVNAGQGAAGQLVNAGQQTANGLAGLTTSLGNAGAASGISRNNSNLAGITGALGTLSSYLGATPQGGTQSNGQNLLGAAGSGISSLWNSMFSGDGGSQQTNYFNPSNDMYYPPADSWDYSYDANSDNYY